MHSFQQSHPSRVRELKLKYYVLGIWAQQSHPSRVRELKRCVLRLV